MIGRKVRIGLGVSLLFAAGVIGLYAWGQQPVEGRLVATTSRPDLSSSGQAAQSNAVAADESWQTKHFSTIRPAGFDVRSSREDASGMASYLLYGGTGQAKQLAVSLNQLAGPLNEVSAVKLRQTQPEMYKPVDLAYAPDGALAFTREADYELSLFWQREGRYVSVVASGSGQQRAELANAMETVVRHWQWQ